MGTMAKKPARLTMYYGEECPHCHRMDPLVERLKKEEGLTVERLEVWHSEENARLMRSRDRHCGGVPFFYNDETRETLCGEVPYSELKKWALGLKG